MITPQRDPNSLVRTKTLAEIAGQDYSATDYGIVEGLKATSLATVERNFTVTAADWVKQYDERRDMKMGMYAPVTQEEYDKSPAAKYGLEFRANENPFSFERRIQKAAKLRHYDDVAQGQDRQVSQLVASLGVGLVSDPVNFIGLGTGASVAKGALYANAGKKAAAAYHTGKGTFKNVLAYGAAFEVPYAFMSNDLGVEKYTYDHLKMAAAMNTVFAGLLSGVSAGASYRNASKVAKAKSDYATYTQFMEGDVPMNDAFSNIYDAGSKGIVEAIKQNKRLVDIAEGRVLADELTLDDMFNMSALMRAHETSTKTTTMVASLADKFLAKLEKGDTSIYKAQREYKGQVKRLTEAVLFGKFDELSSNDIQFLKDNDFELRRQGEDVEDLADPNISPSIFKQEKDGTISNLSDLGEQPSVQDLFTYIKSSAEASGNTTTLAAVQRYLPALENVAGERIQIKQGSAEELNKLGVVAYFDSSNNTITVPKSGMSLDVFLHEVVHGLTVNRIDSVLGSGIDVGNYSGLATLLTGGKSITKPIHQLGKKQFLRYLDELDQKISKSPDDPLAPLVGAYTLLARLAEAKVKGKGMVSRTLTGVHNEKTTYGYSNLKEFLAEFVSNESFRNNVAEIYRQAATSADPKIIKLLDTHFSGSRKKVYGTNVKELISRLLATIKSLLLRDKGLNDIAVASSVTKGLRDPRKVLQDVTVNNKYKASDLTNQTEKAVTGISDQINTLFGSLKKQEIRGGNQLHASYTVTENYGMVTKAEASANQLVVDASIEARVLEKEYFELIEAGRRGEAMDMKPRLDEAKKVVDDLFGETYARMVEDINGMVNEVLLGDKKIIPVRIEKQMSSSGVQGWKYPNELRNYIAEPHMVFASSEVTTGLTNIPVTEVLYTRVLSTLFHEAWHNVKEINITSYNQLLDVASSPEVKKAMSSALKTRGYYSKSKTKAQKQEMFDEEAPPHLLEFALTRPEFWSILEDDNPSLFTKYKDLVGNLLSHAAAVLKVEGFKKVLKIKKPDLVAEQIGFIVKALRDNVDETKRIKKLYLESPKGRRTANMRKKAAYENPNFKSRAEEMRKYSADPVKYLEDTIEATVGHDEALPQLMPSRLPETAKELTEFVVEINETFNKLGLDHLTPYVKDILVNQMGTERRRKAILKVIRKGTPDEDQINKLLIHLKEKKAPLDTAQRVGYILKDDSISMAEKLGKINQYFYEENLAMVLRNVHDASVAKNLEDIVKSKATPAQKVAQLKTILDGSLRKGVERNTSIQRLVDGQIIKDQSPLVEFLVNNDLLEVFLGEDPTKYMSSYRELTTKNPEIARIYGENLKEGSLQLHLDLMDAISSGELPKKWKGVDEFEELVDIIKTINLGQMAEINHLGVNMRQRKGFTGYSMKYDKQVVSSMSEAEFVTFMLRVVDAEQTERLHGGVMEGSVDTKDGKPLDIYAKPDWRRTTRKEDVTEFDRFEINEFLRRFYHEIVSGKFEEDSADAKSIVGSMRKAAKVAFKSEHRNEAMLTLSNFENLGRLLLEQIRNRSEKIALVKNLGHDPYSMVMGTARKNGLDKVKGFSILDATAKQVTGMLDNPVDVDLAQNFQKVRQFSNVVFLAGSGMSALSDIPLMLTTMQYLGGEVTFKDFVASYREAAGAHFRGKDKEMSAWFRSQGAGFDVITRQTAQRVVTGESYAGGLLGVANQLMFELNGLNRITATHQQVFMDLMTNSLGEQFRSGKLNPTLEARMREFGFNDKELKTLAKFVEKTPDGKYRLGSAGISNAPLQRKFSGFLTTYMKEGVLEPDAGAMAISRLGLESGTITGETARVALQYSSFMLGMSRVVYRRFLHGYEGEGKHNAMKMAHLVTYVGAALGFAYMTTVMKDLSKFKEPIDPLDMTFFDFTRILRQSGVLGVTELGLNAAQFGPSATLSPVAGMATDVLSGDVAKGLKPLTGQQYPIIGPVIQKAIGFVMAETVQNAQNDLVTSIPNTRQNTED